MRAFLENPLFCTFNCINPGFDGPWGTLWILLVNGTFIMPQKKSFCQKKFRISCTGSKVPFCQFFHSAKMALLNPCMKFKKKFGQKTFEAFTKNIHNFFHGQSNPGFRSVKAQTETFLKNDSRDFKNSYFLGFL